MGQNGIKANSPGGSAVALDLLRGLAALMVFLCHVRNTSFVEFGALPAEDKTLVAAVLFGVTRLGHEAVMVFFVLSGFLVGGALIRRLGDGAFDTASYAIDRSTRILAPLVPACLLTAALGYVLFGRAIGLGQIAFNILGLNGVIVSTFPGNEPLWTLAYEIWFYVAAGAAAYLLGARPLSPLALFAAGCSLYVFSTLEARYLLYWWAGALMVLLSNSEKKFLLACAGFALFATGVAGYELSSETKSFAKVAFLSPQHSDAAICFGISLAIPYLWDAKTSRKLAFLRPPALYLSSVSYSLYLFHYPLNEALGTIFSRSPDLSWSAIGAFAVRAAILLAAVQFLYWAFEANTPAIRLFVKKRFIRGKPFELTSNAPLGVRLGEGISSR